MKHTNFKSDLSKAKKYEQQLGGIFETSGWNVTYAPDRYFPDYDIQIEKDGVVANIELKVDYVSCNTGNIAVEYCKADKKTKSGVTAGNMNDYIFYLLPDKDESSFSSFMMKKKDLYQTATKHHKFIAPCPDQNGYCYILPKAFIPQIKPCTKFIPLT